MGSARPEYARCLEALDAGVIDGLLVYDLDRLHRQPRELEEFIDLCERLRLTNVASVSGEIDLTTPDGQFQARILGAVAKKESDDKSRRIRRKHEELAAERQGLRRREQTVRLQRRSPTLRPAEAAIVRECARRFLAGESIRRSAADLNERAIPTASGGPWSPQTLRRMLGSARIAGQREHKGEIVAEAEWKAIISKTESAKIRAKLADPDGARTRARAATCWCGCSRAVCAASTWSRVRAATGSAATPARTGPASRGCGHLYVTADEAEAWVLDAVLLPARLARASPRSRVAADDPEAERWQQEADDAQAQLQELATAYAAREIGMPEWLSRARTDRAAADATPASSSRRSTRTTVLDGYAGNADRLRDEWDTLDLTRQHAIVAASSITSSSPLAGAATTASTSHACGRSGGSEPDAAAPRPGRAHADR